MSAGVPPVVCPEDLTAVAFGPAEGRCDRGHRFEVRGGIPRVLMSDGAYTDTFGEQWNKYRTTQLDSFTQSTVSRDRLIRCVGAALWAELGTTPVNVLETGCGAGRFTEVLLSGTAALLTSTDLSSAVDANVANCPQDERHRVLQCDIAHLPFAPNSFDVVICLGVIQHTPDPEAMIAKLYAQVRPGGWLVIDHYTNSFAQRTKVTANVLRPLLKRLPPRQGTAVTEALTRIFFPLHRVAKGRPALQAVVSRISPLLTYYHAYPQLNDELQYEWAKLDTHDSLTDYYKHFRTGPEIRAALSALGGVDIWINRGGNGIEARCRKPGAPSRTTA